MIKKEMIAMLLAGGQGSRLGVLTSRDAKPVMAFGGKYRIIDFPLSNCINSGVDTVGVLVKYPSLKLNSHIGIGIPWDLDRNVGGVTVLPSGEKPEGDEVGPANAVYRNMEYMESFHPEYVLILSGSHVYKMDYQVLLDFHKERHADITIAVLPESSGDAEDCPADMGIYIFNWNTLKDALEAMADRPALDFGRHIIPCCREKGAVLCAYEFHGYWKKLETLNAYWKANMELVSLVPEFNLYEEYWKIYTKCEIQPPQYFAADSEVERSIIGEGSDIYGRVYNSVIGCGVTVGKGTVVRDSIIMNHTCIGAGCELDKAVLAENVVIGDNVKLGVGEETENETAPWIYNNGIVTVGERSVVPGDVTVGRNSVILGVTGPSDYENCHLAGGKTLVKAGERQ